MKAMRSLLALLLLAAATACGGSGGAAIDGGPIGTGITTSIVGNVVDVGAEPPTSPITVTIDEVPGLESTSDADGNFALEGDFAGALTLRFATAAFTVAQALDVPSGSLLVLADVELSPGGVEVQAGRQVGFVGRVRSVDCAGGSLAVADRREPANLFTVVLLPESRFVRRDGTAATCGDVRDGDQIGVDGLVRLRRRSVVLALQLTLAAEPQPPAPVREVPFIGQVVAVDCARGALALAGEEERTRLRLSAATTLRRADGTPLECPDLRLGDRTSGVGQVTLRNPGVVHATTLVVEGPGPAATVRVAGFVAEVDCRARVLVLAEGDFLVALRLLPTTIFEPPLRCEQLALGDRAGGLARVSDDPELLDAIRLRVRQVARREP